MAKMLDFKCLIGLIFVACGQWRNTEGGGPWPKKIFIFNTHSLSLKGPLASGQPGLMGVTPLLADGLDRLVPCLVV